MGGMMHFANNDIGKNKNDDAVPVHYVRELRLLETQRQYCNIFCNNYFVCHQSLIHQTRNPTFS